MVAQASLSTIFFAGALAAGYFAVRSYDRGSLVARELTGLAISVGLWSFFYGFEVLSNTREYRELWSQFSYLGTYGTVAFTMRFCIRWLSPRLAGWWMSLLWIVPVVMLVAAFTNPVHGLVWADIHPSDVTPFVYHYVHGPAFWLGASYQYLLVGASTVLVAAGVFRRRGIYRQQALLVFSGLAVAITANVLYLSGVLGAVPLDITPLSLTVAVGFFYIGVSRARLLELIPAARHRVIDVMPDGLVVLDSEFRVVDWNPATIRLWNIDRTGIMGTPIAELVPGWADAIPGDLSESFRGAIEETDQTLVSHHIDVELRRISMERSRSHGWIVLFHDSTELRAAERSLQDANTRLEALNRELAHQAVRDGLTGLYNRNYLDEVLPREISRAARYETCVGLLILDIDRFKQVNDQYGHGVGDRLLVHVSGRVRAQVRSADVPCRYGGDEMVIVMPGATAKEAVQIGERIRDEVCGTGLQTDDGFVRVTVSLGVALYPTDAADATDLLRNADRALYVAKSQGRDCVVGADSV